MTKKIIRIMKPEEIKNQEQELNEEQLDEATGGTDGKSRFEKNIY